MGVRVFPGAQGPVPFVARIVGIPVVTLDGPATGHPRRPPSRPLKPRKPAAGPIAHVWASARGPPAGPGAAGRAAAYADIQAGRSATSATPRTWYLIHFDGGANPNPRPGGAGVVL